MIDVTEMTAEQIETRTAEIKAEIESADEKRLDELNEELSAIEARKAEIEVERRKADMMAVADGAGRTIEKEERSEMNIRETRQYIDAYADYLKTGNDREVRSLLTENGVDPSGPSAGVPVPVMVEDRIRTAWESDAILSRVKRSNIKGILKVGFELSATGAVVHEEGANAPDEEVLNLGIVSLIPETLKKWIAVSDEASEMTGPNFINYVMDEIEHQIIKAASDKVIADITGAPTTATKTAASVSHVETTGLADVINAVATLSDEAINPVVILNKQSYAYYKGLALAAGYAIDPFDGLEVLFNDTLDAATDTPASGVVNNIAIVGDLQGESVNFVNGYEPTMKIDDLSLSEKDLVKYVGRLPIGHGVTACGRFCVITKTGA